MDKMCLAVTQAPWSSFAPTWRLEYRGSVSEAQLVLALDWVLARYPWCAGRAADGQWVLPEKIDARSQFRVLDLRGVEGSARDEREQALADRFLELEKEPPLALTWVRRAEDAGLLVLQQHHSLADGRAFLRLVADFVRCLQVAGEGEVQSPLPREIVLRRREKEVILEHGLRRLALFIRGALYSLGQLAMANLRPVAALFSNRGTDYTGKDRTRHLQVPAARLEAWRDGRKKLGLSANDLLAGALCVALTRWGESEGLQPGRHNLMMLVDARPREGFESFANHLAWLQVRWRGRAGARPLELARELQSAAAPLLKARLPWKRLLFDGWLTRVTPLKLLRKAFMEKRQLLTNYSFSNLIPLGTPGADADGRWRTKSLTVERLLVTTPCTPPQGANTTVFRYGDELCFNFNFKDTAVTAAQVEALTQDFTRALTEIDEDLAASNARA